MWDVCAGSEDGFRDIMERFALSPVMGSGASEPA